MWRRMKFVHREEARNARKAVRGYEVVSRARPSGMATLSQTLYAERKVV